MSSKKSRLAFGNRKDAKTSPKSVSTQTEQESSEVSNYIKKIDILVKEVELLKKKVAEFEKRDKHLQSNGIWKDHRSDKSNISSNDTEKTSSSIQDYSEVKSERCSDAEPSLKLVKGCSCKGNCGSKICGCVKKGLFCFGSCKCSIKQCKNQEVSKENVDKEALSQVSEKTFERLSYLTLNQESTHESKKKSKRGILSQVEQQNGTPNHEKVSLRNHGSGAQRKLFTQDSDDEYDGANNFTNHQSPVSTVLTAHYSEKSKNKDTSPDFHERMSSTDSNQTNSTNEIHDEHIARRRYATRKLKERFESDFASSDDTMRQKEHNNINSISTKSSMLTKKNQNLLDPSTLTNNVRVEVHDEENEIIKGRSHYIEKQDHSSSSFGSNSSSSNSTAQDSMESSFNPMVPKKQLPRSPINAEGINVTAPAQNKKFSPPIKELAVAEIDWDQHQSELVQCDICKRKFWPHRIEKHVTSCKGI